LVIAQVWVWPFHLWTPITSGTGLVGLIRLRTTTFLAASRSGGSPTQSGESRGGGAAASAGLTSTDAAAATDPVSRKTRRDISAMFLSSDISIIFSDIDVKVI
jgi:hypothetical protein